MLDWIVDRTKERSTWLGITGFATAAGISISPELTEAIVAFGAMAGTLVMVIAKEQRK